MFLGFKFSNNFKICKIQHKRHVPQTIPSLKILFRIRNLYVSLII